MSGRGPQIRNRENGKPYVTTPSYLLLKGLRLNGTHAVPKDLELQCGVRGTLQRYQLRVRTRHK